MILFKSKKTKKEEKKEKKSEAKLSGKDKAKQKDLPIKTEKKVPSAVDKKSQPGEQKYASMRQLYEQETKSGSQVLSKQSKQAKKIRQKPGERAYRILVRPMITEKASIVAAEGKYIFEVSSQANKIEIAKAIFALYGVKPVKVNIIKVKGKQVRSGRITGRRKDRKKAVVTLPKGESINVYEGI